MGSCKHIENKQQNDNSNFFLISNYSKCTWIKLSKGKKEIEEI